MIMKTKKNNKLNKSEYILWSVILCFGIILLFIQNFFHKEGSTVTIYYNGNIIKELPLSENTTYTFKKCGHNTLIINSGYAWMENSDCPDKLCINFGKISKAGESIICLPHKLVVTINNTSKDKERLDAIAK